jgi:hypothetical protein
MLDAGLIITGAVTVAGYIALVSSARRRIVTFGPGGGPDDPGSPGPGTGTGTGTGTGRLAALDTAQVRPALVNFAVTNCDPGSAAYDATILDLAARGYLTPFERPDGLWLAYNERPLAASPLASFEQQVLDDMHGRLKNTGGAPFLVLGDVCRVDAEGTWDPFEVRVRAEARSLGLSKRQLLLTPATVTFGAITAAAVTAFVYLVTRVHGHTPLSGSVFAAASMAVVAVAILAASAYQERLTPFGAGIAARWEQERAAIMRAGPRWDLPGAEAVERRAFAVAANVAGAGPDPAAGSRNGRSSRRGRALSAKPSATRRPTQVWSSFTGTWRLVKITSTRRMGAARGGALIAVAAWLGFMSWAITLAGNTAPWSLLLALASIALGAYGIADLIRTLALPHRATFDGQVIARWKESEDSEGSSGYVTNFAVDDGRQAWTFEGPAGDQLTFGDLVSVTVNPRTGGLIDLRVTEHQRPATPDPDEPAPLADARAPDPLPQNGQYHDGQ